MQKPSLFGFYNLDNFFPIHGLDAEHEFSHGGKKKWTTERYNLKVHKISNIINSLDKHDKNSPLALLAVSEIGSEQVLKDIIKHEKLVSRGLSHEFLPSEDSRGINLGVIYDPIRIEIESKIAIPVQIEDQDETLRSRNIWRLKIRFQGISMVIFIVHLPSQRRRLNRKLRSKAVDQLVNTIEKDHDGLILGDFNDEPSSPFFLPIKQKGYKNSIKCTSNSPGSIKHHRKWLLFDQIWFNLNSGNLSIEAAQIYNPRFLMDPTGRNKNAPFRTYIGKHYLGGPSDHFPVICTIKKSAE